MPQNAAEDTETALVLPKNPFHNVIAHIERVKHSRAEQATVYLMTRPLSRPKAKVKELTRESRDLAALRT